MHLCAYFTIMFVCLSELTLLTLTAVLSDISVPKQVYLQSIHLTRLVSRLNRVKPQQSEWLNTELFSAECGSTLNSSRVATASTNVPPVILLAFSVIVKTDGSVAALTVSLPIAPQGDRNVAL